jgi:filamentous hemagglutinin
VANNSNPDQKYYPKPKTEEITGFPGLKEVRGVGGRPRWIDDKGRIFEWDRQHGTLEAYGKTGKKHLGEFDPKTGTQTKPPNPGRTTPK